jgi:rod shape-determining protein MreC
MKLFYSRGFKIFFACAAGAALIAALNFRPINYAAKNAAYLAFGPLQRGIWIAGANISGLFESISSVNSEVAENKRLRDQVNGLLEKTAQIDGLKKENDILRQGLNLELDKDFDLKLADIVGKNVTDDTLVINKGSKDMVDSGMTVITGQKALVGRISKVYDNFSEVTLITSKGFSFDVKAGDDIDGLAKGQGGFCANLGLVSKDKELKPDDPVYTSALGGIFPSGLLVGTIKNVSRNDVETFQTAALTLAFDVRVSEQVFVASDKYPLGLQNESRKIQ